MNNRMDPETILYTVSWENSVNLSHGMIFMYTPSAARSACEIVKEVGPVSRYGLPPETCSTQCSRRGNSIHPCLLQELATCLQMLVMGYSSSVLCFSETKGAEESWKTEKSLPRPPPPLTLIVLLGGCVGRVGASGAVGEPYVIMPTMGLESVAVTIRPYPFLADGRMNNDRSHS
ncbi:unnamed protein product, partial [Ectocarpus sp. 8 AP-2014]